MVAKEYGVEIDMSNGMPLERRPSFDQRASDFPSDKELFPVEEMPDALIEYPDGGLRVSNTTLIAKHRSDQCVNRHGSSLSVSD